MQTPRPQSRARTPGTILTPGTTKLSKGSVSHNAYENYYNDHVMRLQADIEYTTRRLELEKRRLHIVRDSLRRAHQEYAEKRSKYNVNSRGEFIPSSTTQKQLPNLIKFRVDKTLSKLDTERDCNMQLRKQIDHQRQESQLLLKSLTTLEERMTAIAKSTMDLDHGRDELENQTKSDHKSKAILLRQLHQERNNFRLRMSDVQRRVFSAEKEIRGADIRQAREMADGIVIPGLTGSVRAAGGSDYLLAPNEEEFDEDDIMRQIAKTCVLNSLKQRQVNELIESTKHLEDGFSQVKRETGMNTVDSIIGVFETSEEHSFSLMTFANVAANEISFLNKEIDNLKSVLQKDKHRIISCDKKQEAALSSLKDEISKTKRMIEEEVEGSSHAVNSLLNLAPLLFNIASDSSSLSNLLQLQPSHKNHSKEPLCIGNENEEAEALLRSMAFSAQPEFLSIATFEATSSRIITSPPLVEPNPFIRALVSLADDDDIGLVNEHVDRTEHQIDTSSNDFVKEREEITSINDQDEDETISKKQVLFAETHKHKVNIVGSSQPKAYDDHKNTNSDVNNLEYFNNKTKTDISQLLEGMKSMSINSDFNDILKPLHLLDPTLIDSLPACLQSITHFVRNFSCCDENLSKSLSEAKLPVKPHQHLVQTSSANAGASLIFGNNNTLLTSQSAGHLNGNNNVNNNTMQLTSSFRNIHDLLNQSSPLKDASNNIRDRESNLINNTNSNTSNSLPHAVQKTAGFPTGIPKHLLPSGRPGCASDDVATGFDNTYFITPVQNENRNGVLSASSSTAVAPSVIIEQDDNSGKNQRPRSSKNNSTNNNRKKSNNPLLGNLNKDGTTNLSSRKNVSSPSPSLRNNLVTQQQSNNQTESSSVLHTVRRLWSKKKWLEYLTNQSNNQVADNYADFTRINTLKGQNKNTSSSIPVIPPVSNMPGVEEGKGVWGMPVERRIDRPIPPAFDNRNGFASNRFLGKRRILESAKNAVQKRNLEMQQHEEEKSISGHDHDEIVQENLIDAGDKNVYFDEIEEVDEEFGVESLNSNSYEGNEETCDEISIPKDKSYNIIEMNQVNENPCESDLSFNIIEIEEDKQVTQEEEKHSSNTENNDNDDDIQVAYLSDDEKMEIENDFKDVNLRFNENEMETNQNEYEEDSECMPARIAATVVAAAATEGFCSPVESVHDNDECEDFINDYAENSLQTPGE